MVGVAASTLRDWRTKDPIFAEQYERAVQESLGWHEVNIYRAAREDWRASAWLLERRLPEEYGRNREVDISGGITLESLLAQLEARPAMAVSTERTTPPGPR